MANTYARGDSVISTSCLITPNAPGRIRVEIPSASRGTVVAVEPAIRWAPYLVVFEAGHGGHVEIRVSADKIGRVASHEPLVPVFVGDIVEEGYEPAYHQPHRLCRRLHEVILLEGFTAYGLILTQEPAPLLRVTAVLLLIAYLHQFIVCRRFAWLPEVFFPLEPEAHEELVVDPKRARCAAVLDVAVAVLLGSLLIHHLVIRMSGDPNDLPLFFAHVAVTGLVGALKMAEHTRAAHIYPKDN